MAGRGGQTDQLSWMLRELSLGKKREGKRDLDCCFILFVKLSVYDCAGSLLLHYGKLGPLSSCGAGASHCSSFFCCRGEALQYLWPASLVAPWHVKSSRTRDQTHVPCIAKQINLWTIREVWLLLYLKGGYLGVWV